MEEIGIIGYGELGYQIENLIKSAYKDVKFFYFDDIAFHKGINNSYLFNSYNQKKFERLSFVIGLGYKHLDKKAEVLELLKQNDRKLFTFIHPTAYVDTSAIIMGGTIIYPKVTIDKNVKIGQSCIINLSCTISHDTSIGPCTYISPSVTISGFATIGRKVFLGTGSCVSNNIEIDDSAIIGIGSVITKNVSKGVSVIGNPQRIVKTLNLK